MGTDEHIFIQVFNIETGEWVMLRKVTIEDEETYQEIAIKDILLMPKKKDPDMSEADFEQEMEDYYEYLYTFEHDVLERDYVAYAKLADVRNSYNISSPYAHRRYPDNFPKNIIKLLDFHSPTWFTVDELLSLDLSDIPAYWDRMFISTTDYNFAKGIIENIHRAKSTSSILGRAWELDDWLKSGKTPTKTDFIIIDRKEVRDKSILDFQNYATNLQSLFLEDQFALSWLLIVNFYSSLE